MGIMFTRQIAFLIKHSLSMDSNNDPFIGNQVRIFGIFWLIINLKLNKLPERSQLVAVLCSSHAVRYWFLLESVNRFNGSLFFAAKKLNRTVNVKPGVIAGSPCLAIVELVPIAVTTSRRHNKTINRCDLIP
jgi:Na+/H+ antiporter NhaA